MTVPSQEILDAFNFRFATKTYDSSRKISEADWNLILESARLSPSSFGFEPWNIIVIQNQDLRRALKDVTWAAQGSLPTASHFVIFTAKTGSELRPNGAHLNHMMADVKKMSADAQSALRKKFGAFLNDNFDLTTNDLLHQWAARQAYIALGNTMTAAALLGIDSQPIEGFTIQKVTDLLSHHKLIDPAKDIPVVMASFGYRAMEAGPKIRRPIDEVVSWA